MATIPQETIERMNKAFLEIQMPRTPYMLKELVVDTKYTPEQKYAQMVLELSIAYDNLRLARVDHELKTKEIKALKWLSWI